MLAVRALARRQLTPVLRRTNATLTAASGSAGAAAPPPAVEGTASTKKAKISPSPSPQGPASSGASKKTGAPSPSTAAKGTAARASVEAETGAGTGTGAEGEGEGGEKKRRKRRIVKRRAQISLTNPRKWNPPLARGVLPVYDEALKLISADSARLKRELADVLARVAEVEKALLEVEGKTDGEREALEEEVKALRKKAGVLEIQSDINRPSVRWSAANGMADLNKPVYRHLVEQKWRNYGDLDLLMERIYQMNVVPDILPAVHPSIDLRMSFPEPPPFSTYLRTRTRRKYKAVEPGDYLLPEQTRRPPRLYTSVFHPETRLYTLVLMDADVPDTENRSFKPYLHWLQPNIPLSAATSGFLDAHTHTHTRYMPPHPQQGSPYHRYCLFLLPHVNPEAKVSIPLISDAERLGFDLRAFCAAHRLDASLGGGAHMWREVWDETVSDIYKYTLKQPEPRYGLPPQADPYADVKMLKKFGK